MFWNRYREAFIVGLSLLAGIVLTVLAFLNLLVIGALIPALGAGFGALCLWIAAFVSASLLRQSPEYERCVCARALRTVVSALALMGVVYIVYHFATKGFDLDINMVNAIFLFAGIIMHGNIANYIRAVKTASAASAASSSSSRSTPASWA